MSQSVTGTCVAIVVHYRDHVDTLGCVQSLRDHAPQLPIVVVDNGSDDGSGAPLAAGLADLPGVERIAAGHNGGFGAGCNLGIERALLRPDLFAVLLLNPDARLHPGALAALLDLLHRRPRAGIAGGRIRQAGGDGDWFANGRWPRWTLSRFHCAAPIGEDEFRAGFVSACAMAIRADLLRDGLRFFEPFFLYGEDADLCRQVERRGRELWVTRRVVAEHRGGGSQRGAEVLPVTTAAQLHWQTRAKVLLAARQLRWPERCVFLAVAVLAKPLAGIVLLRRVAFLRPYCSGLLAGLRAARSGR